MSKKPLPPVGKGHGKRAGEKPSNPLKTFKRLISYFASNKFTLILIFILVLFSSGASIFGTYMLQPIINTLADALKVQNFDGVMSTIAKYLVIMGIVYIVGVIAQYVYRKKMLIFSQNTLCIIRKELFEKMQDLPIRFFDTHTHGELMSRFTSDVDTLREAISEGLVQMITSALTVVGTLVMMLTISPLLTCFVLIMTMVVMVLVKVIGKKSASFFRKQQEAVGKVNGYIEELIEGQKVVKVFCRENKTKEEFSQLNENFRKAATNAHTFASILMPITNNLSYVNYAITAILGAVIILSIPDFSAISPVLAFFIGGLKLALSIGALVSFLQYTRQFYMPLTQLAQQFNHLLAALAGAERIFAIIDETPEVDNGYVRLVNAKLDKDGNISPCSERTGIWAWEHPHETGETTYTLLKGDVVFDDVTFSYDGKKDVLKNVSLFANHGQKIAFVGSTGAGKTTITNLINRFYDVPDGKIRYDGINIKKIKKDDLRRSLAMVLQDTHLFTGTVRENIAYGKLDATDDEIIAAAKLSNAHSFIERLPEGYDTMLTSDGANLSQGQRQLLAIARAAVANPPVLILDEATSSIDTRTERLIEKGMDQLMEGRTVFVIAHRLSTVRNADAIMVLEHGEIIERGNHEQLISQKGKYYQLYTGQFELD
ncbi:MAG: ABC transporter ATP-binding protein [Clostridia bacterium]|nr:ABC transporter ATP-binding protein [Clostridia bacterium]